MNLKAKYGRTALVAGASEGLGASFAHELAEHGMDLFLVARRREQLEVLKETLTSEYKTKVSLVVCDLADSNALSILQSAIGKVEIDLLVYNAARSHIGTFTSLDLKAQEDMSTVNMVTPLKLVHFFGSQMLARKRGAIILMSSLAGFQGSGFISTYAATKAFNLVLAEGLWFEWRNKNVDVIACCAGATATPSFIDSKPAKLGLFEPQVQTPKQVVKECVNKLGKSPYLITGRGNRFASFMMRRIFSRKFAITIMGKSTRKMYSIKD